MKKYKIRTKLFIIFTIILLIFSTVLFIGLERYTKDLVLNNAAEKAELLLAHQRAIRTYTIENVRPHLNKLDAEEFISETVPAFSALTVMGHLNKSYPGYDYREAVENPTNPSDKLVAWEKELLHLYKTGQADGRQTRIRHSIHGQLFTIAEPIVIKNPACLACHGKVESAPPSLLAKFPLHGGFGWVLNEPLGIQSVTVPLEDATLVAKKDRLKLITVIGLFLFSILIVLAILLQINVTGPIHKLSIAASKMSMGVKIDEDDFPDSSAEMMDIKLSLRRLILTVNRKLRSKSKDKNR